MNNLDAKELVRSLEVIKKQAANLITSTLTPEVMALLTPEQLAQVKGVKDMKDLNRKGLTKDSNVFKQFN